MKEIKRVKLVDISDLITKGTTPTTMGYEFIDEGINFLKIECFKEDGTFLRDKVAHISEECNEKLKRSQLKSGDILFSIAGAIGRVAIVDENMLPANTNQALAIIRICDEEVFLPYIKLILTSQVIKKQFEKKKQGVAQLNLSLKDIGDIVILLPDKEKQVEYANIFEKVSDILNKRSNQLNDLDNLIKSRFVEIFGDPVSNSMGWNKTTCKKVTSKIGSGATPKGGNESYKEEGISLIRSMNVHNDKFEYKDLAYIDDEQAKKLSNVTIEEHDVLLNITGASVARCCVVPPNALPARVNQHVSILRCTEELIPVFLSQQFTNGNYQKLLWNIATSGGATREAITKQQIEGLEIIVPPINFQFQFATFVQQVDKLKVEVQKSLDEIQILFDSLMQEYFE